MDIIPQYVELQLACLAGIVVSFFLALSLVCWPEAAFSRGWAVRAIAAGVLGIAAAGAWARQPAIFWLPPVAMAAAAVLLVGLARLPVLAHSVRGRAVVVLGVALVAIGSQVAAASVPEDDPIALTDVALLPVGADDLVPVFTRAATDAGSGVDCFVVRPEQAGRITSDLDTGYLSRANLSHRVIRLQAATADYNCHGWVFTGGRYWVRGGSIESILADNGYRIVSQPGVGDLVVYRDGNGEVTHTGVVHSVSASGPMLVESKWGALGRFIHTLEDHPYADGACTFYQTSRGTHVLKGFDAPTPQQGDSRPLFANHIH